MIAITCGALQDGHFDVADRLFVSVGESWRLCTNILSEVKEIVPELYSNPNVLRNVNGYKFGELQDGTQVVRRCCLRPSARTAPSPCTLVATRCVDALHRYRATCNYRRGRPLLTTSLRRTARRWSRST
jgi:hypothetical protein